MRATAEIYQGRIRIDTPGPTPGLYEDIPGARFSKSRPMGWTAPLTLESCYALRYHFGSGLKIGPELRGWAWQERERRKGLVRLNVADAGPELGAASRYPALVAATRDRPYQRAGIRFLSHARRALLADDPGLGKTIQALGAVAEMELSGPKLVVCPKIAVHGVWVPEIERWLGDAAIGLSDGRAQREEWIGKFAEGTAPCDWLVINPEIARTSTYWVCPECEQRQRSKPGKKELPCFHDPRKAKTIQDHQFPDLFKVKWSVIIADEAHMYLVHKTGVPQQTRNGMMQLNTTVDAARFALTGTPTRGRPQNIWGILNWVDRRRHSSYWGWIDRWFERGGYSGYEILGIDPEKEEAMWNDLATVMIRRRKFEVAPDLPDKYWADNSLPSEKLPKGIWLCMLPQQARAYKQMAEVATAEISGGHVETNGILAEISRLRQFASSSGQMIDGKFYPALPSNKWDWLVEFMSELGFGVRGFTPPSKLIIVSQFTKTLEMLQEALRGKSFEAPVDSVLLTGKVKGRIRTEVKDRFNTSEPPHVMLLNLKTGGTAITIDTADDMVMWDETGVPDDMQQVEDRIHRISRPRKVRYHYLRSRGTVEEHIAVESAKRESAANRMLDGSREWGLRMIAGEV